MSKIKTANKILANAEKPSVKKAIEKYRAKRKAGDMKIFDKYEQMETSRYAYAEADVDFSLFNMIMGRVNFEECENDYDGMQILYQAMWPFMAKLINENMQMKTFIVDYSFDRLQELDQDLPFYKALIKVVETETNPNTDAATVLKVIQHAAKISARVKTPSKDRTSGAKKGKKK